MTRLALTSAASPVFRSPLSSVFVFGLSAARATFPPPIMAHGVLIRRNIQSRRDVAGRDSCDPLAWLGCGASKRTIHQTDGGKALEIEVVHDIPVKVMPANEASYHLPPKVHSPQVGVNSSSRRGERDSWSRGRPIPAPRMTQQPPCRRADCRRVLA